MEEPPRKELEYSILITLHINPVYLSNPKKVVSDENTGNAAMKTYEKPKISKCTIFACFFVSLYSSYLKIEFFGTICTFLSW